MAWPASAAPCVSLSLPRKDLASPVRAVLTMIAVRPEMRDMYLACWEPAARRARAHTHTQEPAMARQRSEGGGVKIAREGIV